MPISTQIPPPASNFKTPITPAQILINEFLPNPAGRDEAEFIELINPQAERVDLADLALKIGQKKIKLQGETAQKYIILWKKDYDFNLRNKGETIVLMRSGKEIHQISYQGLAPQAKSFAKIADKWFWTKPSPGQENILVEEELSPDRGKTKLHSSGFRRQTDDNYSEPAVIDNFASASEEFQAKPQKAPLTLNPFFIGFALALILAVAVAVLLK